MRKAKEGVIELGRQLIENPTILDNFLQATQTLHDNRASTGLYFELLHEFGHIAYAVQKGATPVYVKVEKYLFEFQGDDLIFKKVSGFGTNSLMVFDDTCDNLSEAWIHAIKGGLSFTSDALKLKTWSLRSRLFNKHNNLQSKNSGPGSDIQLLDELQDRNAAQRFNDAAHQFHQDYQNHGL